MWIWGTVKVHPATYCSASYIEMQEEVDKTATSWTVWDQTLAVKPMQLYNYTNYGREKKTARRIGNSFSYFVSLNLRREIWEEISQLTVNKVRPQAKTWTADEKNFLLFFFKIAIQIFRSEHLLKLGSVWQTFFTTLCFLALHFPLVRLVG